MNKTIRIPKKIVLPSSTPSSSNDSPPDLLSMPINVEQISSDNPLDAISVEETATAMPQTITIKDIANRIKSIRSEDLESDSDPNASISISSPPPGPQQQQKQQQKPQQIDQLIATYYGNKPFVKSTTRQHELEARFGTRAHFHITKNDYDAVIQTFKSNGFTSTSDQGHYSLRIQNEFIDQATGRYKTSDNLRTEIYGMNAIQLYCRTNDIHSVLKTDRSAVKFINKHAAYINNQRVQHVIMDDFNFVVSYKIEDTVEIATHTYILDNWKDMKKHFRFMNRVTFTHPTLPVNLDISILRTSPRSKNRPGQYDMYHTTAEAGVFQSRETYEIELEVDSTRIGPTTAYNTPQTITQALKKCIKHVLCGLQHTNYPVSYVEQRQIQGAYSQLIRQIPDKEMAMHLSTLRLRAADFIGPSSYTLQLPNIIPINDNSTQANIRTDFVVTEKADGERYMLLIAGAYPADLAGRVYLISTAMGVVFTGARTLNKEVWGCLLDGELITHDKEGRWLNLFAAFDIYYHRARDVRALPFIDVFVDLPETTMEIEGVPLSGGAPVSAAIAKRNAKYATINARKTAAKKAALAAAEAAAAAQEAAELEEREKEQQAALKKQQRAPLTETRYALLKTTIDSLGLVNVVENPSAMNLAPIRVTCKRFYSRSTTNSMPSETDVFDDQAEPEPEQEQTQDIFLASADILQREKEGAYPYNIDGLIYTHTLYGVGANEEGRAGPLKKITWGYSFKWKPPEYNTIDFMVSTVKMKDSPTSDLVKIRFEEGENINETRNLLQYKTVQLYSAYNERIHGFINPCQMVYDGQHPDHSLNADEDNSKKVQQFYPTNPYDPDAGQAFIALRTDAAGVLQMYTKEGDLFEDGSVVEFAYDFTHDKGWRWVPLRVRHDKGENAYHVANDIWKNIHNPITADMISTGLNIPEEAVIDADVYYNKTDSMRTFLTVNLKLFHNYIKKELIDSVASRGATMIDLACGKAGDLPKWVGARLGFVFGIDLSKDNLENPLDGACARYLQTQRRNKIVPQCLFVQGNSAYNIRSSDAFMSEKAIQIARAVFGQGAQQSQQALGDGVVKAWGRGREGFNIASMQFAMHYMFAGIKELQGFMQNLAENVAIGGYFIATFYDGKQVYGLLREKEKGATVILYSGDKLIWAVTKAYDNPETATLGMPLGLPNGMPNNASSVGLRIDVFQESINQTISEYLVNFDYFTAIMEQYGFALPTTDEMRGRHMPAATGLFSDLYNDINRRVETTRGGQEDDQDAGLIQKIRNMSDAEKQISFLNRYCIFKKIRQVDAARLNVEKMGDYDNIAEYSNSNSKKPSASIATTIEDVDETPSATPSIPPSLTPLPPISDRVPERSSPEIRVPERVPDRVPSEAPTTLQQTKPTRVRTVTNKKTHKQLQTTLSPSTEIIIPEPAADLPDVIEMPAAAPLPQSRQKAKRVSLA